MSENYEDYRREYKSKLTIEEALNTIEREISVTNCSQWSWEFIKAYIKRLTKSRHPAASEWKPISEVPLEKWVILNDGESYGCPATPEYFHDEKQKEDFIKRGYKFYAEIYPPTDKKDVTPCEK